MNTIKNSSVTINTIVFLSIILCSININASTVRAVDIDEMLDNTQLVFSGEVIASEAKRSGPYSRIYTFITFAIDELVKGEYESDTVTLSFSGGTVGDTTTTVSGLVIPEVGEKGIYFVTDPNGNFVNPFFGWTQGHLLIKTDENGDERIYSGNSAPIVKMNNDKVGSKLSFSKGVAKGLETSTDSSIPSMKKREFIDGLKARIGSK